jgi:hypothetical protein
MAPPQLRPTRKRTVLKVSDPFGTLHVSRVQDVKVPADGDDENDPASSWKEDRVLWKTSISLPVAWQALKSLLRAIGLPL